MIALLLMKSAVVKIYLPTKRHMISKLMPSHQYAYQKSRIICAVVKYASLYK